MPVEQIVSASFLQVFDPNSLALPQAFPRFCNAPHNFGILRRGFSKRSDGGFTPD
jgi:hypothetical protein